MTSSIKLYREYNVYSDALDGQGRRIKQVLGSGEILIHSAKNGKTYHLELVKTEPRGKRTYAGQIEGRNTEVTIRGDNATITVAQAE